MINWGFHLRPDPGIGRPCRVTSRFSLRGLLVAEGQGGRARLHPPVTFVLVLRLRVKESRAQVGPRVDADRFVCSLVGEGHRFRGVGVSNAHCARKGEESGGSERRRGEIQSQCEEPVKLKKPGSSKQEVKANGKIPEGLCERTWERTQNLLGVPGYPSLVSRSLPLLMLVESSE